MIFPSSDSALLTLHHHPGAAGGATLAIPNPEAVAGFCDKGATRALAAAHGVPIAAGEVLAPGSEARALGAKLGFPLVLKPRVSYALGDAVEKRSARILRTEAALGGALEACAGDGYLAEAFFPGEGVGLSVLARRGVILQSYQHRRLAQASETGPSTRRVSEAVDPRLLRHVSALAEATALTGVAMFEFRRDPATGDHVLLEVNPRFWGSLPLALAAGVDFPALLYDLLRHDRAAPPARYRIGRIKRDLLGEYDRLARLAEGGARAKAGFSALAVMAGVLRPAGWDSWAADDPEPFVRERNQLARRLGGAILKRGATPALPARGGRQA